MNIQGKVCGHINIIDTIKYKMMVYKENHNKKPTVKSFKIGLNVYEKLQYSPTFCNGKLDIYGIVLDVSEPDWAIPTDEYILILE